MNSSSNYITQDEWQNLTDKQKNEICSLIREENTKKLPLQPINIPDTFYVKYGKRILDFVIGTSAFIVCIPINFMMAIITLIDVGHPIIFTQERIGKDGKPFNIIKFRNMTNETDEKGNLLPASQRVTKWGKFVRRTSLDELLNFWCVARGNMSIIGPRPLPDLYMDRYSDFHVQRHKVRPGLDCPLHTKSLAGKSWEGRFDNDIWYAENISFRTDLSMIFKLIHKVFSKKERLEGALGRTGEFIGYFPDGTTIDSYCIPKRYLSMIS